MSQYGFFFMTKNRSIMCSCPHCKSHSIFKEPEQNREELIELMKLSKDKFYLSGGRIYDSSYTLTDSIDELFQEESASNTEIRTVTHKKIDSSNITQYPAISKSFMLSYPHDSPFEMECRKCGETSTVYYYHPDPRHPSPFYTGMTVTEDFRRVHINLKGYFVTFFRERVQAHYYMTRIVFNKANGRVTILRPLGSDNKPLKILYEYTKMWNVTFGKFDARPDFRFINKNDPNILNDLKEKAVPVIVKSLQKRFPYIKENHFDDCFQLPEPKPLKNKDKQVVVYHDKELLFEYVLRDIIRKFRFHDLPMEFLNTISIRSNHERTGILSRVGFLSSQQHTDLLNLAGRKLPKSIRKEVLKSLNSLLLVRGTRFIKSPSNLKKILENFNGYFFESKDFEGFYHAYMNALIKKNERNFKDRDKLEEHCETILINRIVGESRHYLRDTYNQLRQIHENGVEYEIDTELTFRQLHDDVSSALRKIKQPNYELTYTEKEQEVEWTYGSYTFKLASDTHYLIDVGATMNICVGGYSRRAHDKLLHILTVSSPGNPYECCIEMSHDMKHVTQAKIKYNGRPDGELLDAVMKWIEEKGLLIRTHDLPREGVEESGFLTPALNRQAMVMPIGADNDDDFDDDFFEEDEPFAI